MAEVAVAIAILTVAPVRASNLATIRLDENLIRPGGLGSNYLLVFPHYDVKNRVDLTFELDEYVTGLIEEYVQEYRPIRASRRECRLAVPWDNGRVERSAPVRHSNHGPDSKGDWTADHHPPIPSRRGCHLPETSSR